jgi:hypothetical protein
MGFSTNLRRNYPVVFPDHQNQLGEKKKAYLK